MELHLRVTLGLLLLAQAPHLASLQDAADYPNPMNQQGNENGMEPSKDYSSEMTWDPTAADNEDAKNAVQEGSGNDTSTDRAIATTAEPPSDRPGTANATTASADSRQPAPTEAAGDFTSPTTAPPNTTADAQNSTGLPDPTGRADSEPATSPPATNHTNEVTAKPGETALTTADTGPTGANGTITAAPETNKTSAMSSSTAASPPESTRQMPENTTTAAAAAATPNKANPTDKNAASGSSSERGLSSDFRSSKKHSVWGALLGTAVAVACVGMVAYVILKKRHPKGFSHRKLVEEFPSDPVLRLDNNEPLDLNFGGSAYYNPGLQADDIQMNNFPGPYRN